VTVNDSCKCGAAFSAKSTNIGQITVLWVAWINAHAVCRGDHNVAEVEYKSSRVRG
jgi:hypothetical protein